MSWSDEPGEMRTGWNLRRVWVLRGGCTEEVPGQEAGTWTSPPSPTEPCLSEEEKHEKNSKTRITEQNLLIGAVLHVAGRSL
jgi:hypothetical protein